MTVTEPSMIDQAEEVIRRVDYSYMSAMVYMPSDGDPAGVAIMCEGTPKPYIIQPVFTKNQRRIPVRYDISLQDESGDLVTWYNASDMEDALDRIDCFDSYLVPMIRNWGKF